VVSGHELFAQAIRDASRSARMSGMSAAFGSRLIDALCIPPEDIVVIERDDRLIIAIDVCDGSQPCVLRTLRCDLHDDGRIVCGEDETCQLVGDIAVGTDGYLAFAEPAGVPASARFIAWFEREYPRRIDRLEWDRSGVTYRKWMLAGSGRVVATSSTDNSNLPLERLGEPTRRRTVHPLVDPMAGH
jgi:hypothetical protein